MANVACPVCGGSTVRNGKTPAGRQRWWCRSCRVSMTRRIDNTAK
ncbi:MULTISPECIES: IS1/IS1595 family N-terminal zinc-binding domain-containing protein [Actinomycetaceae]